MKVAVCVPCWNKLDLTKRFVESVMRNSAGHEVHWYVVDNASNDGTKEYLDAIHEGPTYIFPFRWRKRNATNIGVNPAWNQLLEATKITQYDCICLSNNDVLVGPKWLDAVERELERDNHRFFLPNGEFSQVTLCSFDVTVHERLERGPTIPATVPGCAGWCMFFPPAALKYFMPIPESMVLWYGDAWIHRKLTQQGYRCETIMDCHCAHFVSQTISGYPGMVEQVARDKEAYDALVAAEDLVQARFRMPVRPPDGED